MLHQYGIKLMQLYTQTAEGSKNIEDAYKARNANELIIVIGRINTAVRLNQKAFQRTNLKSLYSVLKAMLLSEDEVKAVYQSAQKLTDSKRERCLSTARILNTDIQELKRKCIDLINSKCSSMVDDDLNMLVTCALDSLVPFSEKVSTFTMYHNKIAYVVVNVTALTNPNGFVSPKLYLKFEKGENGITYLSMPTNPFIDSEKVSVASKKDLVQTLLPMLDFVSFKAPKIKPSRILKLSGVKSISVKDGLLTVNIETNITPTELNTLIKVALDSIKKAVTVNEFEVIHKLSTDKKHVDFMVGNRGVTDDLAYRKLIRAFGLNKTQVASLSKTMV